MDSLSYDTDDKYNRIPHTSSAKKYRLSRTPAQCPRSTAPTAELSFERQQGNEFTKLPYSMPFNIRPEYTGRKRAAHCASLDFINEIKEPSEQTEEGQVDDRTRLADIIAISNAQCPMQMDGDNLVMTGVALGDANIEFSYT